MPLGSRTACFVFALQVGCSAEVAGLGPDATPSSVTVHFPSPISLTDAASVTIRGAASDGAKSVRVNGVIADTSDDFASWELNVSLLPGENVFAVESDGAEPAKVV